MSSRERRMAYYRLSRRRQWYLTARRFRGNVASRQVINFNACNVGINAGLFPRIGEETQSRFVTRDLTARLTAEVSTMPRELLDQIKLIRTIVLSSEMRESVSFSLCRRRSKLRSWRWFRALVLFCQLNFCRLCKWPLHRDAINHFYMYYAPHIKYRFEYSSDDIRLIMSSKIENLLMRKTLRNDIRINQNVNVCDIIRKYFSLFVTAIVLIIFVIIYSFYGFTLQI